MRHWLVGIAFWAGLGGGCGEEPLIDGPPLRLVDLAPAARPLGPTESIRLRFSAPLDPATVPRVAAALVPFELGDRCALDFACRGGRCYRGRCQRRTVDARFVSDIARPPLSAKRKREGVPLRLRLSGDGRELELQPRRPLAAHRLHTLAVAGSFYDRRSRPLLGRREDGLIALEDLVSGDPDDARPTVALLSPKPGATGVPRNLARLIVRFSKPVVGVRAELRGSRGGRVRLSGRDEPELCALREAGRCFRLRPNGVLDALTVWSLRFEGVRDRGGRALLHEPLATRFSTAAASDRTRPHVASVRVRVADRCVLVSVRADEPTDAVLRAAWRSRPVVSIARRSHELAVATRLPLKSGVAVELSDLPGNRVTVRRTVVAPETAPVVISEVLANPAGSEPAQEFVELYNRSGATVKLAGWTLDDGADRVAVRKLPDAKLRGRGYALVVGRNYTAERARDPPAPKTRLVRLERSLGAQGLKNSGEPIELRNGNGVLVSSYGAQLRSDTGRDDGRSVERRSMDACDIASSWRYDPQGRSSPGKAAAR